MTRRRTKPLRRQPPSPVERAAKAQALVLKPAADETTDDDSLALEESVAESVADLQREWDETTRWLRSLGCIFRPNVESYTNFLATLRKRASLRTFRFARIFPVDRYLFDFDYWLRFDPSDEPPPDDIAEEVEDALESFRCSVIPFSRRRDAGPAPSPDAKSLGPAMAWKDGASWVFSHYRADAPLNAQKARRFFSGGEVVVRVDEKKGPIFVRGALRAPRTPPE